MKTKILTMLAVAAGTVAIYAQSPVYSLNVVGYVNVDVPANQFKMIANQLNTTNNTVKSLIPAPPNNTSVYKYNGTGFDVMTYSSLFGWLSGTLNVDLVTLNPGEGVFIKSPSAFTVTFVGDVMQGDLTNNIPAGFSIRSSMVPQAGGLVGLAPNNNDSVYIWDVGSASYATIRTYNSMFGWLPESPNVQVGEPFFYKAMSSIAWVRNFSAN